MPEASGVREFLIKISKMNRTNQWIFQTIEPFPGNRILDAGCGNGNITKYFKDKELVITVDNNEQILEDMKKSLSVCGNFKLIKRDLSDPGIIPLIKKDKIDTIVCLNALEHIQNDTDVLENFYNILENYGRLIILVPAWKFLYSSLDKTAGHVRRYTKEELICKLNERFFIQHISYFDLFGTIGWFLLGRVFKRKHLSTGLLDLFERLVVFFIFLEKILHLPFGLSLLAICNKTNNNRGS